MFRVLDWNQETQNSGETSKLKKKRKNKQAEYKSQPSRTFNLIRFEKERLEALKRSFERKMHRRRKKTPAIILKLAKKKKKSRNLELLQPIAKSSIKQGTVVIISHLEGGNNPNEFYKKKKNMAALRGAKMNCSSALFVFSSNRSSTGDLKGWTDVVDITCGCLNNKPLFLRLFGFFRMRCLVDCDAKLFENKIKLSTTQLIDWHMIKTVHCLSLILYNKKLIMINSL